MKKLSKMSSVVTIQRQTLRLTKLHSVLTKKKKKKGYIQNKQSIFFIFEIKCIDSKRKI